MEENTKGGREEDMEKGGGKDGVKFKKVCEKGRERGDG